MADDSAPGAILTPSQREFLRGERGEDLSDASIRMTRKRIRERVGTAMTDFTLLRKNSEAIDLTDAVDVREDDVMNGMVDAIALMYLICEESDLNFERVLHTDGPNAPDGALDKAARQLGQKVDDVQIETIPADRNQFRDRVQKGDPGLDRGDVLDAIQDGTITQEEFWSWYDKQQTGTPPGRRGQLDADEAYFPEDGVENSDWGTVVDALEGLLVESKTPLLEDLAERVDADVPMVERVLIDDEEAVARAIASSNRLGLNPTGFSLEKTSSSEVEIHPITEE